jgi:hypothetical protein
MEFPLWWDRKEFFEQFGGRQIDTGHPIYLNYALLLAGWEAIAWDKRCREQFAQDARSPEPPLVERMRRWESWLDTASWVIVESYEWESGLG